MDSKDVVGVLRSVDLFARLDAELLEAIAESSRVVPFSAGDVLIEQDSAPDNAWILLDGEVELHRNGIPKATLGAGDVAGDLSLLSGRGHSLDAVARTDGARVVVGAAEFRAVVRHRPEAAFEFIRVLVDRIYHMQEAADLRDSGTAPSARPIEPHRP